MPMQPPAGRKPRNSHRSARPQQFDGTISDPEKRRLQFHDKISRAELAFIDECGHAPPIQQPAEFARLLHTFLQA